MILPHSVPTFSTFDGKGNVRAHLTHFAIICEDLQSCPNVMAKLFPLSLSDEALQGVHNLPNRSIGSFHQLANSFLHMFTLASIKEFILANLMIVKPEEWECATDLIWHQQLTYLKVTIPIPEDELCSPLTKALRLYLQIELAKHKPLSYKQYIIHALELNGVNIQFNIKQFS